MEPTEREIFKTRLGIVADKVRQQCLALSYQTEIMDRVTYSLAEEVEGEAIAIRSWLKSEIERGRYEK